MYTCKPSTGELEAGEDQNFNVILGYMRLPLKTKSTSGGCQLKENGNGLWCHRPAIITYLLGRLRRGVYKFKASLGCIASSGPA